MTNFERIKTMDKAEMADFLDDVSIGEYDFIIHNCRDDECKLPKCDGCISMWLDMDCTEPKGIDYWIVRQQEDFQAMLREADNRAGLEFV